MVGSQSEDFNAWTGEAPTVLVGIHVQLAGAYDSSIPPVVSATATTNRAMSQFAHSTVVLDCDARVGAGLERAIAQAVVDVLKKFSRATNYSPQRVVVWRCGAFAGENAKKMLEHEPQAIKDEAAKVGGGTIALTYMSCCKTTFRVFPTSESGFDNPRSANVPPGVVVDTGAVHSSAQDFYINTYAGIQGSRDPASPRVARASERARVAPQEQPPVRPRAPQRVRRARGRPQVHDGRARLHVPQGRPHDQEHVRRLLRQDGLRPRDAASRGSRASGARTREPSVGQRLIMANGGNGGQIPEPGRLIGFHADQEAPRFPVM